MALHIIIMIITFILLLQVLFDRPPVDGLINKDSEGISCVPQMIAASNKHKNDNYLETGRKSTLEGG